MIGSVGLFGMIRLKKFAGRAYYRRLITCLPACTLDSGAHRSIGDVPEIPRHQKIDAVRDGDGDMRRIVSGPAWNRTATDERLRETFGVRGRIEKCDSFKRFESEACGIGIAHLGFRNDECRCNKIESGWRMAPPFARDLLVRRNNHIPRWSRRQIADNRSFDVCRGSHHRVGVAFRNAPAHPFSAARFRHACASS